MTGGFLVVRRNGTLWGLPAEAVAGIERVVNAPRDTQAYQVRLADGGSLAVEAVLTLAEELPVRPLSTLLRRFLPPGSSGLALHGGEPILLLARGGGLP